MLERPKPHRTCLGILFVLIGATAPAWARDVAWPEAVAQLAHERSLAQTCTASLKAHGDAEQISRGEFAYGEAKASFDAVIAGLITALDQGEAPKALPDLEADLEHGDAGLRKFCETVSDLLPAEAGQRGIIDDIVKAVVAIDALKDGVAALYNNHRADSALTRATIKTQLEAARWPDFEQIGAAR
ncbi:MAG TPA: hypothetical protein VJY34_26070 [Roseiarcus sp.]|nr:hypothetical protein [Roseiarcus sp.]